MLNEITVVAGQVLADGGTESIVGFFNETTVGKAIASLMAAAGALVVIIGVFKALKDAFGGNMGKAAKTVLGSLVLAAFLIFPGAIITTLVGTVNKVITAVSGGVEDGIDQNGFTNGGTTQGS